MRASFRSRSWAQAAGLALATVTAVVHVSGASGASPKERMTREKIVRYYDLFNAQDERYGQFLAEDVVFPYPTGETFRGREAVVEHYREFWRSGIRERREPTMIVVDNEHGLVAAQLTVHITAKPGMTPTLPGGQVVKPGEEWVGRNVVFYTLRGGKISSIIGGRSTPFELAVR